MARGKSKKISYKTANKILLVLIIVINSYVILAPFWPKAQFEIQTKITKPVSSDIYDYDRSYNHLVIPSLQIDKKIHEGSDELTLNNGLWRRPNTSNPESGGNTVVVGHRYNYKNLSIFYNLDKLKINDQVFVVYNGKIFVYKVAGNKIANANDQTVEANTKTPQLTLYTCTPFWSFEDRLVYTANLEEII